MIQAEIDERARPGVSSADAAPILELERENRELRWSNSILRSGGCRTDGWKSSVAQAA